MEYDIFISYRRTGGKDYARILKPELEKRGLRVFLDFDALEDGAFSEQILAAIKETPVFMIVLSKGALDRCADANDWVAKEIRYAEENGRHIIPVEIDKSFRDMPAEVPSDIASIVDRHERSQIDTEENLQATIDKLVNTRLNEILSVRGITLGPGKAEVHLMSDVACNILHFDKTICFLNPNESKTIKVAYGKHSFTFVSKENPDIKKEFLIAVNADNHSEYLDNKMSGDLERSAEHEKLAALDHVVLRPVMQQGKYGFINENGTVIIPFEYDNASDFEEGLARVFVNGHWGYINKLNRMVIPAEYDFPTFPFHHGLAIVGKNNGVGFIDKDNHTVIPFDYLEARDFSDSLAAVMNKQWKWGYINTKNEVVIPFKYDYAESFCGGFAFVAIRSNYGSGFDDRYYIDKTGIPHPEIEHRTGE